MKTGLLWSACPSGRPSWHRTCYSFVTSILMSHLSQNRHLRTGPMHLFSASPASIPKITITVFLAAFHRTTAGTGKDTTGLCPWPQFVERVTRGLVSAGAWRNCLWWVLLCCRRNCSSPLEGIHTPCFSFWLKDNVSGWHDAAWRLGHTAFITPCMKIHGSPAGDLWHTHTQKSSSWSEPGPKVYCWRTTLQWCDTMF